MPELSLGQKLALNQLQDIASASGGALEILDPPEVHSGAFVSVRMSLLAAVYRKEGGFRFRDRERLVLLIFPDFPFTKPDLHFDHKRFIGQPHVQWGSYICLYQSAETEYQPSDGMFGFFERIHMWMASAGSGQLDPNDAPLHPPVTYTRSKTYFVVKADTPPDASEFAWIGRADLRNVRETRFDVVGWTSLEDWDDSPGHPIAAAILLRQPLATEYPTKIYALIKLVERAGVSFSMLWRLLRLFALYSLDGEPGRFVFGSPMRRKAGGAPLRSHITVWEIPAEPLAALRAHIMSGGEDVPSRDVVIQWLAEADIQWCEVMEDRAEIVHRRDGSALASFLIGKRVLLLGCGALGSVVAECVVRAGAASVCLVDKGVVKPGILVRQRYTDADIGLAKASALKAHLEALGLACVVTCEIRDLARSALSHFAIDEWDLVIDATASANVQHRLERETVNYQLHVPLLSISVSAAASYGSVAVKMPNYIGSPHRISRQAKLEAFAHNGTHPLVKAFWPASEDMKIFQPEPGCSAPTFIGSAADIDYHAAGLLNVGLGRVETLPHDRASVDLIAAPWIEKDGRASSKLSYAFTGCTTQPERRHGYTVLRSDSASRGITAELRRIARTRSDKVETGGLLFGEIDDSHRHIWIDSVSGPPSDSKASPEQFLCGTAGTKQLAAFKAKSSGGSSKFIGIWHTHPVSPGRPSEDDLAAMVQLLHLQEVTPRQIIMLIVGFAATSPIENYYLFRRNEFRLIAVEEPEQESTT